ncbi:MAG TPA: hypothetical protein VGK24_00490 [Candidatus Angelobacter sp.]
MKKWTKVAIPIVAVGVLMAWYAFRPERFIVNRQVDEAVPGDGSAWTTGNCELYACRGGAWLIEPENVRLASCVTDYPMSRFTTLGFGLARIHSDHWYGNAADLAKKSAIGISIGGWWNENPGHAQYDCRVRYGLVASIRTANDDVDIYSLSRRRLRCLSA